MLHKLLQICLMEEDGGKGDGGSGEKDRRDWVM